MWSMAPSSVLIVDDEEKNVKLLKALLSHEGLEMAAATDGAAPCSMPKSASRTSFCWM
jgi:CheY-like chemotaxis protein